MHALSEYKPKDDEAGAEVMIDPDEFTLVLTKTAPYTVNIKTKPAKITEITVNKESFLFAIFYTHFHQCAAWDYEFECKSEQQIYSKAARALVTTPYPTTLGTLLSQSVVNEGAVYGIQRKYWQDRKQSKTTAITFLFIRREWMNQAKEATLRISKITFTQSVCQQER